MANICKNILLIKGGRDDLIDLIQSDELSYKDNKIVQITETCLGLSFKSDWDPPEDFFLDLSEKHPEIEFVIFYIEKLLKKAGRIAIKNGAQKTKEYKLSSALVSSVGFPQYDIQKEIISSL